MAKMNKRRSVMIRTPIEWVNNLNKWTKQAQKQGEEVSRLHIQRTLAKKMKFMNFKAQKAIFKEETAMEAFFK